MYESGTILQTRYQLQRRLGRTAAGRQTWLATDLQSPVQELVIVKLLVFGLDVQWQELELFEREAAVLRSLQHPQIPQYRDSFSIDRDAGNGLSWFALVQDYIAGHSLQDWLDQGWHFSQAQVRQIAEQLLHILQYLHELSPPVLHRDIKPSNIILTTDSAVVAAQPLTPPTHLPADLQDKVYLVDFGAVQDKAAVTGATFTVVGTSGYAPLEQFYGRAVPASDLYGLGATLIHLLTGVPPADLVQGDGSLAFGDRVNLNPDLLHPNWLQTLTVLDLKQRFSSARAALTALTTPPQPAASAQRSPLRPYPYPTPPASSGRRSRDLPAHQPDSHDYQQKIARLELENELLRMDHDWEHEQEEHKIKRSKTSEPVLPDQGMVIFDGVASVLLVIGAGAVNVMVFSGLAWSVIGFLTVVLVGQWTWTLLRYMSYQEALTAYERRREAAIARYQTQLRQD